MSLITVEELKTRWRTLRERFSKEMKIHESSTGTGESQEDESAKWEWFDSMLFLVDHVLSRKTSNSRLVSSETDSNNSQLDENSEDTATPSVIDVPTTVSKRQTTTAPNKRKKNEDHCNVELAMLRTLQSMEQPQQVEDEDDIFCKAVACELRKITNIKEKQRIKAKIFLTATGLDEL